MGHHVHNWFLKQHARYRYRRALDQVRKGNLGVALETLPEVLDHHPFPADIHVALGKTHWQAGQPDTALEHFTQAIAADPASVKAYGNRGLLHYQRGQESQALADWNRALEHQPGNALIHYNRGLLYLRQERYQAALADFDQAIAANPNLAEAYLHRGDLREHLGDWAGAVHDWELALCNDLNLSQARAKLQEAKKAYRDCDLSRRLKAGLGFEAIDLEAQQQGDEIHIDLYRPLGVGMNYFTLPDQVRALLTNWQILGVRRFHLTARVTNQDVVEWQGSYALYQGQPCPPARWRSVLLTAFVIFPPLGIPALVYAINLKQAYRRGDYLTALRASRTIQALCRAGGVMTLTLITLLTGYLGVQRTYDWLAAQAEASQLEQNPSVKTEKDFRIDD
jgi:Tfp pilus assembly protein PilF